MTPSGPRPAALSVALAVTDLSLVRGGRVLFDGVGFALAPGGVRLLRGRNGAGKTSLLLALAGVLRPDSGRIVLSGGDTDTPRAALMHLLLPQPGLKARLTAAENLTFWRDLNGRTGIEPDAALERVGLGGLGPIEAGHLSTGQTRRLALARLLCSRRPVWLLDEPQSALDSEGEALVAALISEHCAAGGMAVIATHHDLGIRAAALETTVLGAPA